MSDPRCEDCRWADQICEDSPSGRALYYCMRYPPHLPPDYQADSHNHPTVFRGDYCGEFKEKQQ